MNETEFLVKRNIKIIPDFLTKEESTSMIKLAFEVGFQPAAVRLNTGLKMLPNIRNNNSTKIVDKTISKWLEEKLFKVYPQIQQEGAVALPETIRFYEYCPQHKFKMHKDGHWEENGLKSKWSFLIYLNENYEGGEIDFRGLKIKPSTGQAIIFPHKTWHEGAEVIAGIKYVMRLDILATE